MFEHPSQKLLALSCAFLAGVAAASFFNFSAEHIYASVILFSIISGVVSKRKGAPVILLFCLFFIGGIWRYVSVYEKSDRLADAAGGEKIILTGRVDGDFGLTQSGRGRFPFLVASPDSENGIRTMVYTSSFPEYGYGEKLEISGRLEVPEIISGFDYPGYLKMQGINTVFYADKIEQFPGDVPAENTVLSLIFSLRDKFISSVNNAIPEPVASYTAGILVGQRSGISSGLAEAFRRTGTSHILAVSGYNITIIAQAVLAICVLFIRRQKAVWLAGIILTVFVLMSGASASVIRAGLMGGLILLASSAGRISDAGISITLAAAVMAGFNPLILKFDVGFQLSFAAVLGLIYVRPLLIYRLGSIHNRTVKDILATTVSAQIMALPILVYHFESLSLVLIAANLLVLPFIPAVMALGFLSGIAGMISGVLGRFVGYWAWAVGMYQLEIIRTLAGIGWSAVDVRMGIYGVIGYYFSVLAALAYLRNRYAGHVQFA